MGLEDMLKGKTISKVELYTDDVGNGSMEMAMTDGSILTLIAGVQYAGDEVEGTDLTADVRLWSKHIFKS